MHQRCTTANEKEIEYRGMGSLSQIGSLFGASQPEEKTDPEYNHVPLLDFSVQEETPYLVMEYCPSRADAWGAR